MELKDTVDLMLSDNYEDRLKAEYMQLCIRSEKLLEYINKAEALREEHELLLTQFSQMIAYAECLRVRLKLID